MKKGFTLVELLAVLVILSIIVLIAGTSYSGLSRKNRKNQCLNIKKQIITAATEFLNDNYHSSWDRCQSEVDYCEDKIDDKKIVNGYDCQKGECISQGDKDKVYIVNLNLLYILGYLDDQDLELIDNFYKNINLNYSNLYMVKNKQNDFILSGEMFYMKNDNTAIIQCK